METVERPRPAGAFGLLGAREVGEKIPEGAALSGETVVVTLSGAVEVTNRLAGTGHAERLGPHEAARISGRHHPVRLEFTPDTLSQTLGGTDATQAARLLGRCLGFERIKPRGNSGPSSGAGKK